MSDVQRALVIGGGIGGPALGLALRMAGLEPVVFEALGRWHRRVPDARRERD